MRGQLHLSTSVIFLSSPLPIDSQTRELLAQAERFVWVGEYSAAIRMLRHALFDPDQEDVRFEDDDAKKQQLRALWTIIEEHFWGDMDVQIHEHCILLEEVVRKGRRMHVYHGVSDRVIKEIGLDERESRQRSYLLGRASLLAADYCTNSRALCESNLQTLEKLLNWHNKD